MSSEPKVKAKKEKRRSAESLSLSAHVAAEKGRKQKARGIRTLLLWIVLIGTVTGSLFYGGRWTLNRLLFENPKYSLNRIDVIENGKLKRERVLTWAKIPSDANLMALDLQEIQANLEAQPSISSAEVRRVLPDRLIIRVYERRPLARLVTEYDATVRDDGYYTIDREGVVMRPRPGEDLRYLPEIRGLKLTDIMLGKKVGEPEVYGALHLLACVEMSQSKEAFGFRSIDVSHDDVLIVKNSDGATVRFSPESSRIAEQLSRLDQILKHCDQNGRRIERVDLTVGRNVPVSFAAVQPTNEEQ